MIYFDCAATALHRPPQVAQAVVRALGLFGGPGRAAHEASIEASLAVYEARVAVAALLGVPSARCVCFGHNATDALNAAIDGLLPVNSHVITTAASHNSVLRPLYRRVDRAQARLSVVPIGSDGALDLDAYEAAFRPDTALAVVTHASNVTGDVYDVAQMARIAHDHGALFVLDAAQTAGALSIDLQRDGLDAVAFTGHKGLMGPQGTGGLAVREGLAIPPARVGGTGMRSYSRTHPEALPEALEAGTVNAHGLAGLCAGVSYLQEQGVEVLHARVMELARLFDQGVRRIDGVRVMGGGSPAGRCGIVALNIGNADAAEVADRLNVEFGICTRAGAHCAPLMHEALGTASQGVVRFSFSPFNSRHEVNEGVRALEVVAKSYTG
ncbi:aminotransferase class V-fold PLP-dependent enzyme [Eggerthellaceae bacterium zg-997]|nr:aminotransferase class V-fold PLP-dependent enzyme [Eggerthellaceae bacterium zg-997]